ncbi:MAG TPA: AsmA family protein, partial [Desulfuromonadales bacterium]|nr:AsmA family protein [Desulfuromonadales bacterium]
MFRRHPLLSILAGLLLLALAAVATFIATFDLNRYREQLQSTLSTALSQPVQLGKARLSWRHGPAFSFADLRIGSGEGETGVLRADNLFLKLELLPLLKREVTFSEILLEAPHLSLTLNPPTAADIEPPSALKLDQGILGDTLIRALRVSNGTLHLLDRRDPDRPFAITLERLEAHMANIALNQAIRLRLAGHLVQDGTTSPLALTGEVKIGRERPIWHGVGVNLELALDHLAPGPLLQRYATGLHKMQTAGALSLHLRLIGSPTAGLRVEGRIDSANLQLRLPDFYHEPLVFQQIRFQGNWNDQGTSQQFTELTLRADEMELAGSFSLEERNEQPWLRGELTNGRLPLLQLGRLLPDRNPESASHQLRQSLGGGVVEIESARFSGPLSGYTQMDADFPLQQGTLRVRDAVLRLERGGPLRGVSLVARLANDLITVQDGKGLFLDAPFHFSGSLAKPFAPARNLLLEAGGTLPLRPLLALLPTRWPEKFSADGPVPLTLKVEGPPEQVTLDLQANLQEIALHWGEQPVKSTGDPGSIFLTGKLTPGRLELSHGRLQAPPLEVRAEGGIDRAPDKAFRVAIDLAPLPLKEIVPFLPALERFALRGAASGQFEITGSDGKINNRTGTFYLRGFGMHLRGAVADINDGNGQFRLLDDGLDFEHVSAKLGISPVRIDGSVRNFSDPRLEMHVQAKTIRADELIFNSEKLVLRDVDGRLVIDKGGILFESVKVRLNGGTAAVVAGTLKDFSAPQVNLDIKAERANIDEVIGLWQRSAEPAQGQQQRQGKGKVAVLIDARVREGILGPLHFQNAEGKIGFADGKLTVFPLLFDAGAGRCTGQVEVDRLPDGSSLLKISGHLENFDAAALQHELFKRRGLITGTLK